MSGAGRRRRCMPAIRPSAGTVTPWEAKPAASDSSKSSAAMRPSSWSTNARAAELSPVNNSNNSLGSPLTSSLKAPNASRTLVVSTPPKSKSTAAGSCFGARITIGISLPVRNGDCLVLIQFMTADDHVMDLVGTVGETQVPHIGIKALKRRPLRNAGRTVGLHSLVNDVAYFFRHHGLGHRHPDPCLLVPKHVHCFRRLENDHTHGFDIDAGTGDFFEIPPQRAEGLTEGGTRVAALHHHVKCNFGFADAAHAVVYPARAQPQL